MSGNQFTMAPERLSTGLCPKSDVFSFGILFGAVILQYMQAGDSELERSARWSLDQRFPMVNRAVTRLADAGAPPALGDILKKCIDMSVGTGSATLAASGQCACVSTEDPVCAHVVRASEF